MAKAVRQSTVGSTSMNKFDVGDEVTYSGISCRVVGVSFKTPYVYSVRDRDNLKISNIPEYCLKHE